MCNQKWLIFMTDRLAPSTLYFTKFVLLLVKHCCCRANIPVIIMGETGCGKTKLIDFMSKLQVPTALKGKVKPMEIVKVSEHVGKNLAYFPEACKSTEACVLTKYVRLCNMAIIWENPLVHAERQILPSTLALYVLSI